MLENTQWDHSTSNTCQPAANSRAQESWTPTVPDNKIFDLGQNSLTSSSFTQLKVLKQWGQMKQSLSSLHLDTDQFMSRLHELFKQAEKLPHKSEQHIHVNTSDTYCNPPTAVTSDFTAVSAYTFSDLNEEQNKETDTQLGQLNSDPTVKKSLIPVRSAPHCHYKRRSLTDSFVRHRGQQWDLTEQISSTTSDAANISTLPTDSRGCANTQSRLSKGTVSLHSRDMVNTQHASLMGHERRLEKTDSLLNALRTIRKKMPTTTDSEAQWKNYSWLETDDILKSWCKLSSGDSTTDAIKDNHENAGSFGVERPNNFEMPSTENDLPLQCFYTINQELNTNPSSLWQTIMKDSVGSPFPAPFSNRPKSFTTGNLSRTKRAALRHTNLRALNVLNSIKPEDFDTKKEIQGEEILLKQPRPLGPRSRSFIPVRKKTPSNEKTWQKSFKQTCGTLHSRKFAISGDIVSHDGNNIERDTAGKKLLVTQLEGDPNNATLEIASSAIQSKVQEVKTNKPPLPKQRFRSNMSSVKPVTPKREMSIKASASAARLQADSPSLSVSPSQKTPWTKQSPGAVKKSALNELQSPRLCCKQLTDDASVLRLPSNRSTSEASHPNTGKSVLATSNNQRQLNQQTSERNVTAQRPVLQSELQLKPHKTNGKANRIMSKPQLQPVGNTDKQRQVIQQRLIKTTENNHLQLKQNPKWQQPKQKQSKQTEGSLSPRRQQTQNGGGKLMIPTLGKNTGNRNKKTKSLLSTVEEKTCKNKNELKNGLKTEPQTLESKPLQDSGPANKDSATKPEVVKALQPQDNKQSPVRMPMATNHSPSCKFRASCSRDRNMKLVVRSKHGGEKQSNKLSLHPEQQPGHGNLLVKNSDGHKDDGQHVCSMDTLNTDSDPSNTDDESNKTNPSANLSTGRSKEIPQKSKSSKKGLEKERKRRSVVWNTSESDVFIQASRKTRGRRTHCAVTDSKRRVKSSSSLRDSAPDGHKRASSEAAQVMPNKLNKRMLSPHKFETDGHVNCDLLSVRMGITPDSGQSLEGRSKHQSLLHKDQSAIQSDLRKLLGSPSQNCQPSDNSDQDEDDKIIQADLEETLIKLYQIQNNLHLRVNTLQDTIKQLQAGLLLLQQPAKAYSVADFQWEGTLYDYLMLLGFMVLQFGIQYVAMNR